MDDDRLSERDADPSAGEPSEVDATVANVTFDLVSPPTAIVPWSGRPAHADDPGAAIAQLPGSAGQDPFDRLAVAFLLGYPTHSARAYAIDLRAWAGWCADLDVHPFDARRHHIDAWIRQLTTAPLSRTGRPMAASSIARRLSAVSALYDYGISVQVLSFSPVGNVRRPKVSDDSRTTGMSADELRALLAAAAGHSPRMNALITLLAYNGLRINEALAANVEDYTYQRGHRVLRIIRKGGKVATEPLAAPTVRAFDTYLDADHPPTGPLFLDRAGGQRMAYKTAYEQLRRLARHAGIPAADKITPHSLRHSFVTEALAAGVPLQDVQDAAGHADPRTTRRYDRSRHNLDRHPTYVLAAHLRASE